MKTVSYKGYSARIEFDPDDEVFVGHLMGLNDVVGFHADSLDGTRDAFHEAVDDYLETCAVVRKPTEQPYPGPNASVEL